MLSLPAGNESREHSVVGFEGKPLRMFVLHQALRCRSGVREALSNVTMIGICVAAGRWS